MKLEGWLQDRAAQRRAKQALLASIALTAVLYFVPFVRIASYPLMLFSTLVHELGHGIAATFVGGTFDKLLVFADGSGVAHSHGVGSGIPQAIVSAGGLVGPAVAGAFAFAFGRRRNSARIALGFGSLFLIGITALYIRNPFGAVLAGSLAAGMGWVALRDKGSLSQLVVVFLAVQLALSVYSRGDYLFTDVAHTGAGVMPSDTANMASALGGSYWMWGLACAGFSVVVLAAGVWWFFRLFRDDR